MVDPASRARGDYTSLHVGPKTTNTETDDNASDHVPPKPKTTVWRRTKRTHHTILILGSIVLLLALTALGLLWKESMIATSGAGPREPWVQVLSENQATTYVTVCSAFIRASMAFQASLATAMFAAIILERIGVPFLQAPLYSILRALDVAPNNLLSTAMFKSRGPFSWFIYTLVVIEVLLTIASQFLSTILISDFGEGTFANLTNSTVVSTWEGPRNDNTAGQWWTVPPAAGWTFAEHSEPVEDGPTFYDTGPTYRAFLPFEEEAQRTMLRRFNGPALVMNQRVACARPTLGNLTFNRTDDRVYLQGQIGIDPESYPETEKREQEELSPGPATFKCPLPITTPSAPDTARTGQSTLCFPVYWPATNISFKDPFVDSRDPGDLPFEAWRTSHTHETNSLMVIDVTSIDAIDDACEGPYRNNTECTASGDIWVERNDRSWAIVTTETDAEPLRVTACITDLTTLAFGVDIQGDQGRAEPRIPWDSEAERYNTEAIRRQLGASLDPEDVDSRGILKLAPRDEWERGEYVNKSVSSANFFDMSFQNTITSSNPEIDPRVKLSTDSHASFDLAHPVHVALFQDTLRDTDDPALAVQAVLARIHQMAYYNELPVRNTTDAASTSFSVSAQIPVRWTGLIAATSLITAHFIIMAIVTTLFLCYTSYSLVGSPWQAVSQVVSEDTLHLLERVDGMGNKDVRNQAKAQSVNMNRVSTLRRRRDGRVTLGTEDLPSGGLQRRLKEQKSGSLLETKSTSLSGSQG